MRKLLSIFMVLFLLVLSVPALASTYDISVTAAGDRVNIHQWYSGGSDWVTDVSANPNQVSHNYEPGWGDTRATALSFDLSSIIGTVSTAEIVTASLYYNILDIWTSDRNDIGNLDGVGTVYYSGGRGWKFFDITDGFRSILSGSATTANYNFSFTGYSGFTFSSAEGGAPAYLRIATAGTNSVPEPTTMLLLGLGLVGLAGVRRKFKK